MDYYFIYSAGGGAGDWNGLKRVWKLRMPIILKRRILLKFGDVFYNHASSTSLIKPQLWRQITNMRRWLSENVDDDFVNTESVLLLDSGTSKIVNHITTNHEDYTVAEIVRKFNELVQDNGLMRKYVDVIVESNIQEAVTFDVPNPFKIRTQSANTRTTVFSARDSAVLIETSAAFANQMFHLLGNSQDKILTTINGLWTDVEIDLFLSRLDYVPNKLAIGGLTRSDREMEEIIRRLNSKLNFRNYARVHFLGCGGIKIAKKIKLLLADCRGISVDNSTPWNRSIDGNTNGTAQSGYFDYVSKKMIRIKSSTVATILEKHRLASNTAFTIDEMNGILRKILEHQSNNSSLRTYEARALLAIHNNDVFRTNAN